MVKTMGDKGNTQPHRENTQPLGENTQPLEENTQPPPGDPEHESADDKARFEQALTQLPQHLQDEVQALRRRVTDHDRLDRLIVALCQNGPCTKDDLALLLGKREDYLRTKYINGLLRDGRLNYLYPEVLNHPQQAYVATGK